MLNGVNMSQLTATGEACAVQLDEVLRSLLTVGYQARCHVTPTKKSREAGVGQDEGRSLL